MWTFSNKNACRANLLSLRFAVRWVLTSNDCLCISSTEKNTHISDTKNKKMTIAQVYAFEWVFTNYTSTTEPAEHWFEKIRIVYICCHGSNRVAYAHLILVEFRCICRFMSTANFTIKIPSKGSRTEFPINISDYSLYTDTQAHTFYLWSGAQFVKRDVLRCYTKWRTTIVSLLIYARLRIKTPLHKLIS